MDTTREGILKLGRDGEERLLLSQLLDKQRQAQRYQQLAATFFLDLHQQALCRQAMARLGQGGSGAGRGLPPGRAPVRPVPARLLGEPGPGAAGGAALPGPAGGGQGHKGADPPGLPGLFDGPGHPAGDGGRYPDRAPGGGPAADGGRSCPMWRKTCKKWAMPRWPARPCL